MKITEITPLGHEHVIRVADPAVGLVGFIAVHSTTLGPAAGGLRMRPYDTEEDAIHDVLRLSRGMTLKNAAADLPLGGGKAVIMGDPKVLKTPELLGAFGRAIQGLNGSYWTAEDMGMSPADMVTLSETTDYVAGLPRGKYASGDPSPITARGIYNAIRTACDARLGGAGMADRRVIVQGLGNVGMNLCGLLADAGAQLVVADIDDSRVQMACDRFDAAGVALDKVYDVQGDVFAPCAIGGILNATTIPRLRVPVVAGGANNQLRVPGDGDALHQRGILYAPDFVANGGGIINVATEILRIDTPGPWVGQKLTALDHSMRAIFAQARSENQSPNAVAEAIVSRRLLQTAA